MFGRKAFELYRDIRKMQQRIQESMKVDYLIVGSGLTGATIARHLADAGREVLVVDRRPHPGGNVHDHVHPSNIRIHTYGPHYFRTNSAELWEYVNRFGDVLSLRGAGTVLGGRRS